LTNSAVTNDNVHLNGHTPTNGQAPVTGEMLPALKLAE
jgi:hypothetical protein